MPIFSWKKGGHPRPQNVLEKPSEVYDLNPHELQRQKLLKTDRHVSLTETTIENKTCFEIVAKKDGTSFSVFRSTDQGDADKNFALRTPIINCLLRESVPGVESTIKFLNDLNPLIVTHPTWHAVHFAVVLKMAGLFTPSRYEDVRTNINEARKPEKMTALMLAIQNENLEIVRLLLAMNARLDLRDRKKNLAIHHAAMSTPIVLKEVLKVSHEKFGYTLLGKQNKYGLTPLHLACYTERHINVTEFLHFGLPVQLLQLPPPQRTNKTPHSSTETLNFSPLAEATPQIVAFDKQMIDDMDFEDVRLGGSPLHWTRYRRTMDKLYKYNFPTDLRNFNKETVVHVMARKNRLMCLMSALVKEYPVNKAARGGYTALHYAVKHADMSIVQALVVFDADVNIESKKNQSPRHVVATDQTINEAPVKLFVLNAMGARRCIAEHLNCAEGCSITGADNGQPARVWPPLDKEHFYDDYLLDRIVKEALARKQKEKNDDEQKGKANNKKKKVNMLCIDGGGVKGILTIQMLMELEKRLDKPLHEYFQWISGTSTGSFIAACLCLKKSLTEIRAYYCLMKDDILQGTKPYATGPIEKFLKDILDDQRKMFEIRDNKLLIAAALLDRSPAQLHLFRSYQSPLEIIGQKETVDAAFTDLPKPEDIRLWEAVRASSAAPLYFSPHGPFVDGGLIANNPAVDTMTEFYMRQAALERAGRMEESEELSLLVSLGTGRWPIIPCEVLDVGQYNSPTGMYKNIRNKWNITATLGYIVTQADNYVVDRAQCWCRSINVPYFRISPPLSEQLPLDVTEDAEIINSLWEAKSYAYILRDSLDLLAVILGGKASHDHVTSHEEIHDDSMDSVPLDAAIA